MTEGTQKKNNGAGESASASAMMPNLPTPDFARMATTAVNSWSEVNAHLLSFAQASLRNNLEAAEDFARCRSPEEMADAQMRFARRAYESYLDEARQLGSIFARLSTDAMEAMGPERRA